MSYVLPIAILAISISGFVWAITISRRINAGFRVKWRKITDSAETSGTEMVQRETAYLFEIWNTSAKRSVITSIQIETKRVARGQFSSLKSCDDMIALPIDLEPGRCFTLKISEDRINDCLGEDGAFRVVVDETSGKQFFTPWINK